MAGRTTEDLINAARDKADGAIAEAQKLFGIVPDVPQDAATTDVQAPGEGTALAAEAAPAEDKPTEAQATPQDKPTQTPAVSEGSFVLPEGADPVKLYQQTQKNYDNLRTYADRTQTDNATLRREIEDLKRQIQFLSLGQPPQTTAATTQQPAQVMPGGDPQPGGDGAQAMISTQGDERVEASKVLEALASEYPDSIAPIVKCLQGLETDLSGVKQTISSRVEPAIDIMVKDEQQRTMTAQEAAHQRHLDEISKGVPNWQTLVFNDPSVMYTPEGELNAAPALKEWMRQHPAGSDYYSLLFPAEGERGGTPGMVIKILKEFQDSPFAQSPEEKLRQGRLNNVAEDVQGEQRPKSIVLQQPLNTGTPLERLRAGGAITRVEYQEIMSSCRDATAWATFGPLLDKAQTEGRIIDPNLHRDIYYKS